MQRARALKAQAIRQAISDKGLDAAVAGIGSSSSQDNEADAAAWKKMFDEGTNEPKWGDNKTSSD